MRWIKRHMAHVCHPSMMHRKSGPEGCRGRRASMPRASEALFAYARRAAPPHNAPHDDFTVAPARRRAASFSGRRKRGRRFRADPRVGRACNCRSRGPGAYTARVGQPKCDRARNHTFRSAHGEGQFALSRCRFAQSQLPSVRALGYWTRHRIVRGGGCRFRGLAPHRGLAFANP